MRYLFGFMCVLALGVMGCGESGEAPPDDSPYANKDLWLCRPDIDNDHCDTAEVDCFYVYPSINFSPEPGNTEVLFPHSEESIVIVSVQAAPYRGACRLFAPLYHQMSEFTYLAFYNQVETTEYHQRAYGDVVEAFEYYMRNHNKGRGFILIGHSQGSQMLTKLLEEKFDGDEALRGQLVSALLTGPANRIQVLEGEVTAGSFANIPLCTSATETGCIIAFDANAAGVDTFYQSTNLYPPPSARACVNPASIDGGSGTLGAFVYPRSSTNLGSSFPDEVD
ncbi:MAG: DUF3089 domain-containing protein, partial [Deltaproteobacteria bacterium]|nr:DUF3089 domain-containing protein [Deltaproteobacteria bacterium]